MKILLSSNKEIIREYIKEDAKIGFIATASELDDDRWYMEKDKKDLIDMKFNLIRESKMLKNEIFDCHCHFVDKKDFECYKKTAIATKFLNVRSINSENLTKPYKFETFEDEKDMFFTEAIDLYNLEEELIRVEENLKNNNRIVAIKIYLGYQSFYANDERIHRVAELAKKYGVSVVFHCGETWSPDDESENKDQYSDAKYIEDLAIRFKDVNFIGSHLNWPNFDNIFNLCEKYENVFTCISGCLDATDRKERDEQVDYVITILNKYLIKYPNLKNKLMYGTDFFPEDIAYMDVSDYIKIIKGLELKEEEKEKILSTNIYSAYKKLIK